jgi:hypothetical protein
MLQQIQMDQQGKDVDVVVVMGGRCFDSVDVLVVAGRVLMFLVDALIPC